MQCLPLGVDAVVFVAVSICSFTSLWKESSGERLLNMPTGSARRAVLLSASLKSLFSSFAAYYDYSLA